MATITAAGNGNYRDGATWTGGSVPGNTDVAETGAYTVQLLDGDNLTAAGFTNTGGGKFNVATGTKNLTLNGPVTASGAACVVCNHSGGTVTVNGNITGGSGASCYGLSTGAAGAVTVTGNILAGANATAYGLYANGTGQITITGNSTGATSHGTYVNGNSAITLTGQCRGSDTASNASGVATNGTGTIIINGTCLGGTQNNSCGLIVASGASTATVSSTATGATDGIGPGVRVQSTTATVTVNTAVGNNYGSGGGSSAAPGVTSAANPCRVKRAVFGAYGQPPCVGATLFVDDSAVNKVTVTLVGGSTRDLVVSSGSGGVSRGRVVMG